MDVVQGKNDKQVYTSAVILGLRSFGWCLRCVDSVVVPVLVGVHC